MKMIKTTSMIKVALMIMTFLMLMEEGRRIQGAIIHTVVESMTPTIIMGIITIPRAMINYTKSIFY